MDKELGQLNSKKIYSMIAKAGRLVSKLSVEKAVKNGNGNVL